MLVVGYISYDCRGKLPGETRRKKPLGNPPPEKPLGEKPWQGFFSVFYQKTEKNPCQGVSLFSTRVLENGETSGENPTCQGFSPFCGRKRRNLSPENTPRQGVFSGGVFSVFYHKTEKNNLPWVFSRAFSPGFLSVFL